MVKDRPDSARRAVRGNEIASIVTQNQRRLAEAWNEYFGQPPSARRTCLRTGTREVLDRLDQATLAKAFRGELLANGTAT